MPSTRENCIRGSATSDIPSGVNERVLAIILASKAAPQDQGPARIASSTGATVCKPRRTHAREAPKTTNVGDPKKIAVNSEQV